MLRIGLVDLDTSHGPYYATCINRLDGFRVTAVYDGGAVRPPGYLADFAREHAIDHVCATVDELVTHVDAGMVLSQDWDLHVERARPFLEAGKPVYIDKPLVGRLSDIETLADLADRTGAPVMGGSSLRYDRGLAAWRDSHPNAATLSVFASGPGDFFNYGCHVVDMVGGLLGPGAETVTHLRAHGSDLLLVDYATGIPVVLQFGAGPNHHDNHLFLAITTATGVQTISPGAGWGISEALIEKFAQFVREGRSPTPLADSLETVRVCLAGAESRRLGRPVRLDGLPRDSGFDGATYTADYARGGGYEGTGLRDSRAHYR